MMQRVAQICQRQLSYLLIVKLLNSYIYYHMICHIDIYVYVQ